MLCVVRTYSVIIYMSEFYSVNVSVFSFYTSLHYRGIAHVCAEGLRSDYSLIESKTCMEKPAHGDVCAKKELDDFVQIILALKPSLIGSNFVLCCLFDYFS